MSISIQSYAATCALTAHKDQTRKYTGEPYIVHCAEVAHLVASTGARDEVVAAAWLHDVIEDTGHTKEQLMLRFGTDVASLVVEVSDVSKPEDGNRETRKRIDREHYARSSPEGATIKLADLISNTRSIVRDDPNFAKVYLEEKRKLLPLLTHGNAQLHAIASAQAGV